MRSGSPRLLRSLLFCPAHEPRKVQRLAASGADAVVLDLEDSVPVSEKAAARAAAAAALPTLRGVFRMVRINGLATGVAELDLAAVMGTALDAVILPKATSGEDIGRLHCLLDDAEPIAGVVQGSVGIVALVESALGIRNAFDIAAAGPRLIAIALGSVDLGTDLGLPVIRGDLSAALAFGRSKLVYDVRAAGLPAPLDGPFVQVRDSEGLSRDCTIARGLGYGGRICIHPDQVPVVNAAFSPDPEEVALARRVVAAFDEAERAGSASIAVDGVFVDYPVAATARRIVALAESIAAKDG